MSHKLIGKENDISVIVNVWGKDSPHAFARSLRSIGRQTLKPSEVLIVIDGPINAQLEDEIAKFEVKSTIEVRVIRVSVATGLWNGRNAGIAEARNEIIALHDADDVMHPDRLRIQLNHFENAEIDILSSPVYEFDADNGIVLGLRMLAANDQLTRKILWQNVINHSSVMMRKSAVVGVGGYRNVHLAEDYDLWLRLVCANKKVCTTELVLQAFSVDWQLNKRRGGPKFIASELTLHRLIRSTKTQNVFVSWFRLILRLIYRLGPRFARNVYGRKLQAKKSKNSAHDLEEFLNNPPLNINLIS